MSRLSPERRKGSQELLAMEFCTSDGGSVVGEFSPCKPFRAIRSGAALAAAFDSAAAPGAAGSPCAVADLPGAPSTASQPSSATSSLAAALADLQVASRQSSENDLGDRSKLLAALGLSLPGGAAPPGAARRLHSRGSSSCGEEELLAASASADEDGMCSPQLIGAVRNFDSLVLKTLTPIKTRSRAPTSGGEADGGKGAAGAAAAPHSPAAPYADSLVSPFREPGHTGLKPKQLQAVGARPVIYHSRSTSMTAPGAYNPYDLTAAALSSEFRSPAKSLHSPSPSQWGSASYRTASYRAMAAQQALAAQKDDEPDFYVSVPGVRRQQSLVRSTSNLSSMSSLGSATAAAAAAVVAQHQQPDAPAPASAQRTAQQRGDASEQQRAPAGPRLERQPTLGSGTAVHGFKGLFRNIIVAGSSPPPAPGLGA